MNVLKSLFDPSTKKLNSTKNDLAKIRELEKEFEKKSFEEMRERINEMRSVLAELVEKVPMKARQSITKVNRREQFPKYEKDIQDKLIEYMPEVYAMINESYKRVANKRYYDVQLMAGILLARGQILVEQYTGEGKTQTFQLPLALYSLAGRGAHLVTVNNYLTKVGAEYAGHMLSKLGISVGVIAPEASYKFISDDDILKYKNEEAVEARKKQTIDIDRMTGINLIECRKQDAYACDITYATNNELGFDYLRDNMAWSLDKMVQRELYFCIIDEADSILIDEARTPLIISATPSDADTEKYARFAEIVKDLEEGEDKDYIVDHKSRSVNLTEKGIERVEHKLGVENAWEDFTTAYHIENALKAKALFHKDDQYIIKNGRVYIVDEFTGRVLEGRRYSAGIHQAIEAKEGVEIKQESKTFATITFQNFFRLYKVLCGGSGTIMTEAEEFYKIYGVDSVVIPTNKPRIRIDYPDRIYKTQEAKFKAVVEEIKEMNKIGRPVLVGTTSVEKSELVSRLLDKECIKHEVLNAKFHEQEAQIIAKAGKKGAVTVATNMAGRGTDIVIGGGSRGDDAYKEIVELGGLHVIGTERHDSRRIDNQLRGRTGRQGEPGSTRFYVSLDDQIMRILGGEFFAKFLNKVRLPDNMPIEMRIIAKQIEMAQKKIEGINFDNRKRLVEYDDVMNQHREIFYQRRRSFLETAENALGIIRIPSGILNTNLQEKTQESEKYSKFIENQKENLEDMVIEIVQSDIERSLYEMLNVQGKLEDQHVETLVNRLLARIPKDILKQALGTSDFTDYILSQVTPEKDLYEVIMEVVEKAVDTKARQLGDDYYNVIKMVALESLDKKWVDHLEIMKDVRDSISLQGYAQRDPLVEYKNRAFLIFQSFINSINSEISQNIFRVTRIRAVSEQPRNMQTNEDEIQDVLTGDREMIANSAEKVTDKARSLIENIEKARAKRQSTMRTNSSEKVNKTEKNLLKKYGRNDKVTVRYGDGRIVKDVKFKKVIDDIKNGLAEIV
ncbi:MAG: preprotein translocase subunit SecA [Candidatus Dojkabacteria bacterium]